MKRSRTAPHRQVAQAPSRHPPDCVVVSEKTLVKAFTGTRLLNPQRYWLCAFPMISLSAIFSTV